MTSSIAPGSSPASARTARIGAAASAPASTSRKAPRRYGVVADWPRTRSGKSDFEALGRLCGRGAYEPLA